MKIVDRAAFLALPEGTIFAKFGAQPKDGTYINLTWEEVQIKGETSGYDYYVQDLFTGFEGETDDRSNSDALKAMLGGMESPPLGYDSEGRDALFDDDQLFAVWSRQDALNLIARLREAFKTAYGEFEK